MIRSLPSFIKPEVHAQERNTNVEGEDTALGSEKGSNAEKDDEVRVGAGA